MIASVLALKALLIGLALWASLSDLRRMEIPNTVPVLIVLAFAVLVAPQIGIEATLWRLAVGGGCILVLFPLFLNGAVGAGDIKLLAAALLMAPATPLAILWVLVIVSIGGVIVFALHRLVGMVPAFRRVTPGWKSWQEEGFFPYGPAIAIALVYIAVMM